MLSPVYGHEEQLKDSEKDMIQKSVLERFISLQEDRSYTEFRLEFKERDQSRKKSEADDTTHVSGVWTYEQKRRQSVGEVTEGNLMGIS